MRPIKIVFSIRTPICLTYPWIHFDSIIAHLKLRRDYEEYRYLPSKRVINMDIDLPFKKTIDKTTNTYIYNASVSIFDFSNQYYTNIYKRFCEKYLEFSFNSRLKNVDRSRGTFKDFKITLIYIPATEVTFYANGDKREIEELLCGLPGLGKKTSIGFGFIKDFDIEYCKKDISVINNGVAMKPIPMTMLSESEDIHLLTYKPPYWDRSAMKPCAPPFSKVLLSKDLEVI